MSSFTKILGSTALFSLVCFGCGDDGGGDTANTASGSGTETESDSDSSPTQGTQSGSQTTTTETTTESTTDTTTDSTTDPTMGTDTDPGTGTGTTTDPDTGTTGPAVCDPGDNPCQNCIAEMCCDEQMACAANDACGCMVECITEGNGFKECFNMCGGMKGDIPVVMGYLGCIGMGCGQVCGG